MSDLLHLLEERGFIHQCTDADGLRLAFAAGPVTAYLGFDAPPIACMSAICKA